MFLRSLSLFLLLSVVVFCSSSEEKEEGVKNGTSHWRNHHHHRGRHGHFHRHLPAFLEEVSKGAKKEYYRILFRRNSTRAEIKKNIEEWAKKNGVEKEVAEHNEKRELFFSEHNKNVTEAISKLAAVQSQILAILKDQSLTHKESWEKIHQLTKDYSPQLKALVNALKPQRGGWRGEKKGGKKGGEEEKKEDKKGAKKGEEEEEKEEKKKVEEEEKKEEKKGEKKNEEKESEEEEQNV